MGKAAPGGGASGGKAAGRRGGGWQIRVRGLVQGVGFRPMVWRLGQAAGLSGEVLNDAEGVLIRLAGPRQRAQELAEAIRSAAPPLARIDAVEITPCDPPPRGAGFAIVQSAGGTRRAAVTPDAATCPDCRAEIADPADRRFGYAFTNCTNCGPRLSITRAIPYDRANTSMAAFRMCPPCRAEYENPADRRFHAQPNACPDCGPRLWLVDAEGRALPGDPLAGAARVLQRGGIVAIKGVGGWQLAVDATEARAVATLRRRKRRPHKPLALMAADIEAIRRYCQLSEAEARELRSPAAPIVLLRRREDGGDGLPESIAPGMNRLGFMLPNTPLHHLLMARLEGPVVLTSGNATAEPQITGDDAALARLSAIADAFLGHDREVVHRVDDSVVQFGAGGRQVLRHARGLAPAPLALHPGFAGLPPVLAMGGDLKNAFCLLARGQAVLSPHVGDMSTPRARRDLSRRIDFLRELLGAAPARVAVDAHPGYYPSQLGREIAGREGAAVAQVQHHHAHVAAVMAGAGLAPDAAPVLGVVLDGLGWGSDGTIWGGEFLRADFRDFRRLARFAPVPMPGGDAASRQPWRNLLAHLHAAFGGEWLEDVLARHDHLPSFAALRKKPWAMLAAMIEKGVNAPPASSAGRLFDAVAAALGLCFDEQSFEGQAAMLLQARAERGPTDAAAWPVTGGAVLNWAPMWKALLADLADGRPAELIAARFHHTLARAVADTAAMLLAREGLERVVLSGGVFQNALLAGLVQEALARRDIPVLAAPGVPLNDGGLALGQAAIAAAGGGVPTG